MVDIKHSHSFAFVCWSDGPRPSQKEIISLRAFMLLFLKQLILKVQPEKCLIIITQPRKKLLYVFCFFSRPSWGACRPNLKFECLFRELHWKLSESLSAFCVCVCVSVKMRLLHMLHLHETQIALIKASEVGSNHRS